MLWTLLVKEAPVEIHTGLLYDGNGNTFRITGGFTGHQLPQQRFISMLM